MSALLERSYRLSLMLGLISAFFFYMPPSRADNAETFKAACMPKCAANGHNPEFCGKFCACMASETVKKFGDKAFSRAPSGNVAPEEFLAVPTLCNARYVEEYFETGAVPKCAGDADCVQTNRCIAKELRALGSEAEAGALLAAFTAKAAFGTNDAPRLARYEQMTHRCTGRVAAKSIESSCLQQCGAEPECKTACSCLAGKIKGVGDEAKLGAFLIALNAGEAEASRRHGTMLKSCGMEQPN